MIGAYFIQLWNTSKWLFFGILLFVLGQSFFMYKGILNFPFFPFQMYAFPFVEVKEVSQTEIYINKKLFNYTALPDWDESTILGTLNTYERYQSDNNWAKQTWFTRFGQPNTELKSLIFHRLVPTEKQIADYPKWLSSYISSNSNQEVNTLNIRRKYYLYDNQRMVPTGQEDILLDYRK